MKRPHISIKSIRDAIRSVTWTRNDLCGGTPEEFRKQQVGPRLERAILELRTLIIPPRFINDIAAREEEITRCQAVIVRWHAAQYGLRAYQTVAIEEIRARSATPVVIPEGSGKTKPHAQAALQFFGVTPKTRH
jgi:hypothetical protein